MSIEKGLVSTDVDKIRNARSTAKGQVTKKIQKFQEELLINDDKFLLDEIDDNEIQELYQKLNQSLVKFEDLHERFLQYRDSEADADAEEIALNTAETYLKEVTSNFSAAKRLYNKYKKALAVLVEEDKKKVEDSTRAEKIAVLAKEIEAAKKKLVSKKKDNILLEAF